MNLTKNPDTEWASKIEKALKQNKGYCPCSAVRSEDTKCICADFRQKLNDPTFAGYCHCNYYRKDPTVALSHCVTGDTLVSTEKGGVPIRELVNKSVRVFGSDGVLHEITGASSLGIQVVATLTTQNGHFIRTTLTQKFLTKTGDKEMRYLTLDDALLTVDGTTTRLESIRLTGSEEVFDLAEPESSHYIANGLTICARDMDETKTGVDQF